MGQTEFGYYETFALELAVDLVNTRSEPTGEDTLADAAGLARFLHAHADFSAGAGTGVDLAAVTDLYGEALSRWTPTGADAGRLRELRTQLRAVFDTAATDRAAAVATLNAQLRTHRALPRISDHHDTPHLHFEAAEDGLTHWLAVTVLMALVLFVCGGRTARLGSCASRSCRRAFIDRSKNASKTYCSDTCAHRESVTAYRTRQRTRTTATTT